MTNREKIEEKIRNTTHKEYMSTTSKGIRGLIVVNNALKAIVLFPFKVLGHIFGINKDNVGNARTRGHHYYGGSSNTSSSSSTQSFRETYSVRNVTPGQVNPVDLASLKAYMELVDGVPGNINEQCNCDHEH